MAGNVSAAHQAFSNLLTTLTPDQIQKFVQEMQAGNAIINNVMATNPASNTAGTSLATVATGAGKGTMAKQSGRASSPRGKRDRENAKLRPLNSFIAFRSFYSAIFPELTQKVKSGLLRFLWQSDPFKAKWAILAKAYSVVRDNNIGKVTLESFLALNGEFIGIVPPARYLNAMSLQLIVDGERNYSLAQSQSNSGRDEPHSTTNYSVDDIVNRCYETGYVDGASPVNGNTRQGAGAEIAFAAQPSIAATANANASNLVAADDTSTPMALDTVETGRSTSDMPNVSEAVIQPSSNGATPAAASTPENGHIGGGNVAAAHAAQAAYDTQRNAVQDMRLAAADFPSHNDEYYGLFNPAIRRPILRFNPYTMQDQFNAFDITQYIDL